MDDGARVASLTTGRGGARRSGRYSSPRSTATCPRRRRSAPRMRHGSLSPTASVSSGGSPSASALTSASACASAPTLPDGDEPFPVIIKNDVAWAPSRSSRRAPPRLRLLQFLRADLQTMTPRPWGPAWQAYPEHDWRTLAVWAWGTASSSTYLLTLPRSTPSASPSLATPAGQGRLLAGAMDDRIAPHLAQRLRLRRRWVLSLRRRRDPPGHHHQLPHWFVPRLSEYADREDRLPSTSTSSAPSSPRAPSSLPRPSETSGPTRPAPSSPTRPRGSSTNGSALATAWASTTVRVSTTSSPRTGSPPSTPPTSSSSAPTRRPRPAVQRPFDPPTAPSPGRLRSDRPRRSGVLLPSFGRGRRRSVLHPGQPVLRRL